MGELNFLDERHYAERDNEEYRENYERDQLRELYYMSLERYTYRLVDVALVAEV